MNSFTLKLIGKSELPEMLEVNNDYLISVNATITNIDKGTDEQGGFIYTHKAKLRTCEILKSNGQIIKAKVKGSQSQKLRLVILGYQQTDKPDQDENAYYEMRMGQIRHFLPEIISLVDKLDK